MSLQALLFLGIYAGGLLYGLFRNPFVALGVYFGVFFVHPPSRWWGTSLPDLRWSLIAAAVAVVAAVVHSGARDGPRATSASTPVVLLAMYVGVMWLQVSFALTGDVHLDGTIIMSKFLLVMILLQKALDTPERLGNFLMLFAVGGLYLGWLSGNANTVSGRVDGVGGPGINDASSLGMLLACAVLVSGCAYLYSQGWQRWMAVAVLPFALNGLIATGSRGAFVALVAGGLAIFVLRPRGELTRLALYGAAGVALLLVLGSTLFWDRINSMTAGIDAPQEMDNSAASRIAIVKAQMHMVADHPLGVGHKGTAELSTTYIDARYWAGDGARASHNTVMSAFVDQGVAGGILWLMVTVWALRSLMRNHRQLLAEPSGTPNTNLVWLNASLGGSLAAIIAGGMFSPQIKAEPYYWFLALLVAMNHLVALHTSHSQGENPEIDLPPLGGTPTIIR